MVPQVDKPIGIAADAQRRAHVSSARIVPQVDKPIGKARCPL
jgi:hypothetical protein